MARRPLEIGEIGNISVTQKDGKTLARCRVRAQDGTIKYAQATIPKMTKTAEREAIALCRKDAETKAGIGEDVGDITPESLLVKLIDDWWEGEKVRQGNGIITSSTLENYKRTSDMVREGIGGDLRIRECSTPRLERFVIERAAGKWSVHRDLKRILTAIFERALELNIQERNPARFVKDPIVPKRATTALNKDEVMRLRQLVRAYDNGGSNEVDTVTRKRKGGRPRDPYLADLVDIMLATGTRIGEVLALRWEDVELGGDPVTVEITGTVKTRKADASSGASYLYRQPHPKSKRSERIITVPKFAADILLRLHVEAGTSEYVFATSSGTLRSPHNVRNALRKACGDDMQGLTPHTLRRTVATIVAEAYGIETASRLLGHADLSITDRAYNRPGIMAPDTSNALERLGGVVDDMELMPKSA